MLKHLLFILIISYSIDAKIDELKTINNNNISSDLKINNNHLFTFSIGKLLLLLFLLLLVFIIYTTIRNTKIMNKTIEEGLSIIKKNYNLKEIEVGEFRKVTLYKFLSFYSKVYYSDEIGVLSILIVNIGIMQMITFNINPFEKDLPQLSIDYIYIFSKRKAIIEIYDLMIDKNNEKYKNFLKKLEKINEKNANLESFELKKFWYIDLISFFIAKSGTVEHESQLFDIFKEIVEAYIKFAKEMPEINNDDKDKKYLLIKSFSDKLIEKGGVSVDKFKKAIGIEKTRNYFGKVVFCYFQYQEKKKNNLKFKHK
jgi:hypothetical protein